MFGYDYLKQEEFYFPYSDIEKTFIDMVYFKEKLSEEALKNIIAGINRKKLNSYLRLYSKKMKERVLKIIG